MSDKDTSAEPRVAIISAQAESRIMRNTLWNLLGSGLPVLLALVTFPVLIHAIGAERFGVLTIAWVVLGYFGLFDLGMGRATIKFLAEDFEHRRELDARSLFWTSTLLNVLLGFIGGVTLGALAPLLVDRVLNVPAALRPETLDAFFLMAASVPLVTLTTALRGVLEARHRFGLLNALQAPLSALTQIAPLLLLPFTINLSLLVGALLISRVVGAVVFLVAALRQFEKPMEGPYFQRDRLHSLFAFGGWLTVTNVIGPLMVYVDRLVIGSLLSLSAVTYYTTPYEAVTRLSILPSSLMRTVFPLFSALTDRRKRSEVYLGSAKRLGLILAPVLATGIFFASDLLRLWIGEKFVENSTMVLQVLAMGVFVNSLALVPFNLIQGVGRTDITAKFHLLELPIYLLLLWYGIAHWGILGAAIAWTVRVTADGLLLVAYVRITRLTLPLPGYRIVQTLSFTFALIVLSWVLSGIVNEAALKVAVWAITLGAAALVSWRTLMPEEKEIGQLLSQIFLPSALKSRFRQGEKLGHREKQP